ncbi:hypothetical protein ScalyP_jg3715 [Parmales sp. scaly parma]|jgi:hypothetical protein|nr:hypothetical protein ScalyP_jg3715 [Parmales sp. scaly parma]
MDSITNQFNKIKPDFLKAPCNVNVFLLPPEQRPTITVKQGISNMVYSTGTGLAIGATVALGMTVAGRGGPAMRKSIVGFCGGVGLGRGEYNLSKNLQKVWGGNSNSNSNSV